MNADGIMKVIRIKTKLESFGKLGRHNSPTLEQARREVAMIKNPF